MSIPAGSLNRRVVFKTRSTSQDAAGQPVETWTTYATRWADIRAPKGLTVAERLIADREAAPTTYSVRMRYCTDITPAMRAEFGGQVWDIVQVVPDHAGREFTDVVCVVGVA